MKTKDSAKFVEHALKQSRAKFAVVGKGTTWTFYEGADVANAAADKDQTCIKGSCQKKQKSLSVVVVGGQSEITILKNKVFAQQLKTDDKAMIFKALSSEDNANLDNMLTELEGSLMDEVGQLKNPVAREAIVPLFNQAKELAFDGQLGPARVKLEELKTRLLTKDDSAAQATERSTLLKELQGVLSEQVGQLKNPLRETATPIFNQALKLATGGDLQLAKTKVAELKKTMAGGSTPTTPPQRPTTPPPTSQAPPKTGPTLSPQRVVPPETKHDGSTQALEKEILQIGQSLMATNLSASKSILADFKACLAEHDAAQKVQKLQALRTRALALRDGGPTQPVDKQIMHIAQSMLASWPDAAKSILADLKGCLAEKDPAQRTQKLQTLLAHATQMKGDDAVLSALQAKAKTSPAQARPEQGEAIDDLHTEVMFNDMQDIRAILPELHFLLPQPAAKKFRDRFKALRAKPDGEGFAALLTELRGLPEVQKAKSEGPAKAKAAISRVASLSKEQITKLSAEDRIDLLKNLRQGGGINNKDCASAMARLQESSPLEKDFVKKDTAMRRQVLNNLVKNNELRDARRNWLTLDKNKRAAMVQKALAVQCQAMGIDVPTIELVDAGPNEEDGSWTVGSFQPATGKIRLNPRAPDFSDFDEVLDTIIHENTHNYQYKLVEKLEAGQLKKGDPEYNQAVLFQLNMPPAGYLDPASDAYKVQSTERHAWEAGGEAAQLGQRFDLMDKQMEEARRVQLARDEVNLLLEQIQKMATKLEQMLPNYSGSQAETSLSGLQTNLESALLSNDADEMIRASTDADASLLTIVEDAIAAI